MIITRHQGIYRFGKHEQPVTITDDDGRLFDTVLFFEKLPSVSNIERAAQEYVVSVKTAETAIPDSEVVISVAEVEAVLKGKGLMESAEKWQDWKAKPTSVIASAAKEQK